MEVGHHFMYSLSYIWHYDINNDPAVIWSNTIKLEITCYGHPILSYVTFIALKSFSHIEPFVHQLQRISNVNDSKPFVSWTENLKKINT